MISQGGQWWRRRHRAVGNPAHELKSEAIKTTLDADTDLL